jgi:bifunctional polynucleotide phosphatase/kinase
MEFKKHKTIYYSFNDNSQASTEPVIKLACFDIDYTIIKTKSGKKFPISKDDWVLLYDNIPQILKEYSDQGYQLVFFTNQMGISKGKSNVKDLIYKFNKVRQKLGLKIDVLMTAFDDNFRKPMTGMWDFYCEYNKITTDKDLLENSFYCGDAAGRLYPTTTKKVKKDFNSSDKFFAHNIGIKFKLPEEAFKQTIPKYSTMTPYADLDLKHYLTRQVAELEIIEYDFDDVKEMVILVGKPASGKSTFARTYYPSYKWINMDSMGTKARCIKNAKKFALDCNVIIDNTNASKANRLKYIHIAENMNMQVKIYIFDYPLKLCKHLNNVRVQSSRGTSKKIPDVAYHVFNKYYEEPKSISSQVDIEIIKLEFVPEFKDDMARKQFMYCYNI